MYKELIKEICAELNIKCTFLSKGWITMLECDNKIKYLSGYKFDLNYHASALSIDDKYAMYEILSSKKINVIEHKIMYDESNDEEYAKNSNKRLIADDYFNNHQSNIVIKSNTGTCGKNVFHVESIDEINKTLDHLFKGNFSISLCPFYNIKEEYRVIILNNQAMLTYGKIRPVVKGDGTKKISELLHDFNPNYYYQIKDDFVLPKGETYSYSWKHNLSNGSMIDNNINNAKIIEELALKAATILNIEFGSVDIIQVDNEYKVLECNSGVMMDNLMNILPNGRDLAKSIYKQAIINLFK